LNLDWHDKHDRIESELKYRWSAVSSAGLRPSHAMRARAMDQREPGTVIRVRIIHIWRRRERSVAGLEGVVAKCRDSRYEPGRRIGAWVKMRIGGGQEFVICRLYPKSKKL
jgi:hypothetical protein